MWIINVAFGSGNCSLLFKTEEAATLSWTAITKPWESHNQTLEQLRNNNFPSIQSPTIIKDDFGCQCFVTNVLGASFEDMSIAQEKQIEIALHHARTQVKANQRGQSDPTLQAANRLQGPGVISPMMGGANGRGF